MRMSEVAYPTARERQAAPELSVYRIDITAITKYFAKSNDLRNFIVSDVTRELSCVRRPAVIFGRRIQPNHAA
jgi:hypothetical protein